MSNNTVAVNGSDVEFVDVEFVDVEFVDDVGTLLVSPVIVTVKLALPVFPAVSFAEHVIVLVPIENVFQDTIAFALPLQVELLMVVKLEIDGDEQSGPEAMLESSYALTRNV